MNTYERQLRDELMNALAERDKYKAAAELSVRVGLSYQAERDALQARADSLERIVRVLVSEMNVKHLAAADVILTGKHAKLIYESAFDNSEDWALLRSLITPEGGE